MSHRLADSLQNQLGALISQIYSWNETLRVSDSSSVHHQEFFTVHTTMVYVTQVSWQLAKPTRCTNFSNLFLEWNSTCFGQFFSPSSGVFSLYTQKWWMSHRLAVSLQNQQDALISQICSWNEILHVSDSSPVHHQEFFTVHTSIAYVIQVCWQLARKLSTNLYEIRGIA